MAMEPKKTALRKMWTSSAGQREAEKEKETERMRAIAMERETLQAKSRGREEQRWLRVQEGGGAEEIRCQQEKWKS